MTQRRWPARFALAALMGMGTLTASTLWNVTAEACTAFYAVKDGKVLVGNNEDGSNPNTRVWTVPGEGGSYGRLYVGYDDLSAQGGINEKGLWFDAFALPLKPVSPAIGEIYPGDLQDKIMAECATVAEVLEMLKRCSREGMSRYQWMFGDKTGASAIIEAETVIPIRGSYQVVTNFRQSQYPDGSYDCPRYRIATRMLGADPNVNLERFRSILAATHSEGQDPTLYSYICDLENGLMYLYHFHNYEEVVVLDVAEELAKGRHVYDLPALFGPTNAAEDFYYHARSELAARKAARLYSQFDAKTYPDYSGRYRITRPNVMSGQLITVTPGASQLYFQLNGGGKLEVLPGSPTAFFLLGFGGMDFQIIFPRDQTGNVHALVMEGSGLSLSATKVE